jgi:hypothetical protein
MYSMLSLYGRSHCALFASAQTIPTMSTLQCGHGAASLQFSPEGDKEAIEDYERALKLDPNPCKRPQSHFSPQSRAHDGDCTS